MQTFRTPFFQPWSRPLNELVVIESNSNQPQNFVIGNCLKCQALVKVSALADRESLVKCPRCSEKFKLYTVLDQFVPELELVEEHENQSDETVPHVDIIREYGDNSDKPRTKFVVPRQLAAGARKRRRKKRRRSRSSSENGSSSSRGSSSQSSRSSNTPELMVVKDAPESSASSSQSESSDSTSGRNSSGSEHSSRSSSSGRSSSRSSSSGRSSRSSRSRKKSDSSAAETLKVVAGGLLALPLAYMLLFWVFHRDPLNVAPMIHGTFPSAVPEVLIPESESVESEPVNEDVDEGRLPIPDLDPDNIQGNPDLGF
jgi:hypothetical protein